jgi:hypothetical protein
MSLGEDFDILYERRLQEQQPKQTQFKGQAATDELNKRIKKKKRDYGGQSHVFTSNKENGGDGIMNGLDGHRVVDELDTGRVNRESGVKGMKWGTHKEKLSNPKIGTSKYPGVSKLVDSMMDGNIPPMPSHDYNEYIKSYQKYMENHEPLMKKAEAAASRMSQDEIDTLGQGEESEQNEIVKKYGEGGKAANKLLNELFDGEGSPQ